MAVREDRYVNSDTVPFGDYNYYYKTGRRYVSDTVYASSYDCPTVPCSSGYDYDIEVMYRKSSGLGVDSTAFFRAGVAETIDNLTFDGNRILTISGSGTIKYVEWCESVWKTYAYAEVRNKMQTEYQSISNTITIEGESFDVVNLVDCFRDCKQMVRPPSLSTYSGNLENCFRGCSALREAPVFPRDAFNFNHCFDGCTSLEGNVSINAGLTYVYLDGIFDNTSLDIFIEPYGGSPQMLAKWEQMAANYPNVHYEANDNPVPAISNLRATRVAASGSTSYAESGQWAYIQATLTAYDQYIPEGWTNSIKAKTITDNGATETPTWYPSQISSYPADVYCWIDIGDTAAHTFTLQITDSVKTGTTEKRSSTSSVASYVLAKAYALVDAYHDDTTDSEGLAIGKFAEHADLLDVDMPIRARQELQADKLLTADEDIALGLSCHTGTSSTAAGTTTKVVTTKTGDFTLTTDVYVVVRFTNATSVITSLNVDGRGSKTAYYNGSRISSSNGAWAAGETCIFQYNGTRYNRIDYADTLPVDVRLAYQTMALGWDDVLS